MCIKIEERDMKRKFVLFVSVLLFFNISSTAIARSAKMYPNQSFKNRVPYLIKLAEFSENVYKDKKTIKALYKNKMKKVLVFNTSKKFKVQFMVLIKEKNGRNIQYVAIRGTDNMRNVGIDLMGRLVKAKKLGIRLHRGFKLSSEAVYRQLKNLVNRRDPIIITGHSLGGAIAFILGMYLQKDGYPVREVVTFGQPRVFGKKGIKKYHNFRLYRVVNRDDIVTRIPPIDPLLKRYYHVKKGVKLVSGKKVEYLHIKKKKRFSLKALKNFFKRLKRMKDLSGLNDHKIKNYIKSLRRNL